jgi:CXXC-20-CXXC protein
VKNIICPKCGNRFDFWSFMKSPTPFHMKCKTCQSKLKIDKYGLPIFILAILVGAFFAIIAMALGISGFEFLVLLILAALIFESFLYALLNKLGIKLVAR